ncbi:MAG: class I SAM-dependent methyltransferase [Synergistaceae bacterium]|jgi:predicted O-methyltransferase YrrM|nr:class I SAM-dependent methyltransferase [Synergistaceae bacterium]
MDFQKTQAYIEGLYAQHMLTQKQYSEQTDIENYGQVVDDDVARMLQVLILAAKPQKVLEIGTSIGFSTVMMAKAVKHYGGKIITIELDEEVARQAKINFKRQGVEELIDIIVGDARVVVAKLNRDFDLIFQDVGDKTLYAGMFDSYISLLKTGGMLIAEDSLFPLFEFSTAHSYLNPMRDSLDMFNKKVAECPYFESTLLPIGDGLTIAVKK